jgi:3-deoxy-D-manno-octulosonate 8-phosphate phosphatase (KDO 8-P phosphatase)
MPSPRARAARRGGPRARRAAVRPARPRLGARPPRVRVLFLDVDGTLTDGVLGWDGAGDSRRFFVRDGLALQWARELDLLPVVISGRASRAVTGRMEDLGLEHYQGVGDKVAVAGRVLEREGVPWSETAMVGDDLPDVPLLTRVAWAFAVPDAVPEVKRVARTVTRQAAGRGAVREVVEILLRHNGTWDRVRARYGVT